MKQSIKTMLTGMTGTTTMTMTGIGMTMLTGIVTMALMIGMPMMVGTMTMTMIGQIMTSRATLMIGAPLMTLALTMISIVMMTEPACRAIFIARESFQ